jgi:hypothetical protein
VFNIRDKKVVSVFVLVFLAFSIVLVLQQSAVNLIYDFLGAESRPVALLNLAGPLTGLLIQLLVQ